MNKQLGVVCIKVDFDVGGGGGGEHSNNLTPHSKEWCIKGTTEDQGLSLVVPNQQLTKFREG